MKSLFLAGVSAVSLAALAADQAAAQSISQTTADNPIAHCRDTTETDRERIACLEAAIMGMMSTQRAVAGAETLDRPPTQDAEDDRTEARLAAAEAEAEEAPTGLGAEQVIARQEREDDDRRERRKARAEAEAVEARIVDFARTAAGRLILVLDNGQVWAQRTGDVQDARLHEGDTPSVKVRRGVFSGYRMEIDDPNLTIVVERLK